MSHWTDKDNERIKDVPLSRVPEVLREDVLCNAISFIPSVHIILQRRLEEALLEIDRLREGRKELAGAAFREGSNSASDFYGAGRPVTSFDEWFDEYEAEREGK